MKVNEWKTWAVSLVAICGGALAMDARADDGLFSWDSYDEYEDVGYADDSSYGLGDDDYDYYDSGYLDDSSYYGDEWEEDDYGYYDSNYSWESEDDDWFS